MQIVPLGPGFAAEVRGCGLAEVAERDDAYSTVRAAFEQHSVLLFRDQPITDDLQVAYSQRFGPLELTKVASRGAGSFFALITNLDADGKVVPPDHRQILIAKANALWHSDSTFKETPALASVLSARQVPEDGGETEFASTRLAWARLSGETRAKLERSFAWHDYGHSRGKIAATLTTNVERQALPPVCWRMAWRNPANDATALYIASHAYAIDGMAQDEAQALLAQLIDDATRPEFVWRHRWRNGDVIMWDNRAVLHRGRPWPYDKPRHMIRTTISARDVDGLASVRPPSQAAA